MVERLVANEKVEGSTPFARSKIIVIKSKFITKIFQNYLKDIDIRFLKKNFFYYIIFRIIRNFLDKNIIIKIYNFKIYGSIKKNDTSYFLLKKCEFGDYHEIETITRISNHSKIFLLDCGCNYGFYSFHTASIRDENQIVSVEASSKTSEDFLKNKELNKFENISFHNKAISDQDDLEINFHVSENDWESSLAHKNYRTNKVEKIKTCKIDTLLGNYNLKDYILFFKLDIEGNEINAIKGGLKIIEKFSPIIIIEISKFIFDKTENINYLSDFLNKFHYQIYDTNKNLIEINDILSKLNQLTKKNKTIGNYYLIKKNSKELTLFKKND